jgi:hypothetical protein
MKTLRNSLALGVTYLALVCLGFAQEGHPLKGTWTGDWGPSADHRNQVTIVMDYEGDNITGLVNPGPGSVPFSAATLDTADWTVHIEVQTTDSSGAAIEYMIDGTLEDIGLPDRRLSGTWVHGTVRGDFSITRQ